MPEVDYHEKAKRMLFDDFGVNIMSAGTVENLAEILRKADIADAIETEPAQPLREGKTQGGGGKPPSNKPRPANPPPSEGRPQKRPNAHPESGTLRDCPMCGILGALELKVDDYDHCPRRCINQCLAGVFIPLPQWETIKNWKERFSKKALEETEAPPSKRDKAHPKIVTMMDMIEEKMKLESDIFDLKEDNKETEAKRETLQEQAWHLFRGLEWGIDLIDMYDKFLVSLGQSKENVYSESHMKGLALAKKTLQDCIDHALNQKPDGVEDAPQDYGS